MYLPYTTRFVVAQVRTVATRWLSWESDLCASNDPTQGPRSLDSRREPRKVSLPVAGSQPRVNRAPTPPQLSTTANQYHPYALRVFGYLRTHWNRSTYGVVVCTGWSDSSSTLSRWRCSRGGRADAIVRIVRRGRQVVTTFPACFRGCFLNSIRVKLHA